MRQKAHRFKSKIVSREEVQKRFDAELNQRIDDAVRAEVGNDASIYQFFDHKRLHYERIYATESLRLLDEYEKKGRSTKFNGQSWMELLYKKYFSKPTLL